MAEAAAGAVQWIEGRNGGRLRNGGTARGPNRATTLVRQGIIAALRDPKGGAGKDFWLRLKAGNGEDRRCFANICSRLIPVEIKGDVAESLTVTVQHLVLAERDTPLDGTCVIGESQGHAPIPESIDGESQVISDQDAEEKT